MFIPMILFCLLLVGATAVAVVRWRAPKFAQGTAVGVVLLSLLYWLLLRGQVPLTHTVLTLSEIGLGADVAWTIDAVVWLVTFGLLLLLLVTILLIPSRSPVSVSHHPLLFLLTAVTLASIWASSLLGMVLGWSALLLLWGIALGWLARQAESSRFLRQVGLLLTAVLLLWLAAASVPAGFAADSWPPATVTVVLLAALLQMGIWPFADWRPSSSHLSLDLALWLALLPVVTGAVLFMRVLAAGAVLPASGLLLTLAGLFGLLQAVRRAWARLHLPLALASFLAVALAHLLLLTAVWGNEAAMLAMLQLFIFGSGIFYLAGRRPLARRVWWRWLAPGVALAALAGLPFTVGLVGHLALYEGLEGDGRFVLLLVLIFLQMPLLTAGLRLFWPEQGDSDLSINKESVAQDMLLLLLALGLLSGQGFSWNGQWLAWLAVFLVPVGGLLLLRFTPEFRQTTAAVRQAFTFRSPLKKRHADDLQKLAGGLGDAFREAAAILEGDGSLLWLLILVLVLMLVR